MVMRDQKITLGEMRAMGVGGLLVYCSDYHCSHWGRISADRWPDHVRLSDLEPLFVCQAYGTRLADLRPTFIGKKSRNVAGQFIQFVIGSNANYGTRAFVFELIWLL